MEPLQYITIEGSEEDDLPPEAARTYLSHKGDHRMYVDTAPRDGFYQTVAWYPSDPDMEAAVEDHARFLDCFETDEPDFLPGEIVYVDGDRHQYKMPEPGDVSHLIEEDTKSVMFELESGSVTLENLEDNNAVLAEVEIYLDDYDDPRDELGSIPFYYANTARPEHRKQMVYPTEGVENLESMDPTSEDTIKFPESKMGSIPDEVGNAKKIVGRAIQQTKNEAQEYGAAGQSLTKLKDNIDFENL